MRLSIKGKQIAGVSSIVGIAVIALSALNLTSLARMEIEESASRADLLASAVFHRARDVVAAAGDSHVALREDAGLRSILESSVYSSTVTFAALVAADGTAIAHSDAAKVGRRIDPLPKLPVLIAQGSVPQLRAIFSDEPSTYEIDRPLLIDGVTFGSIRVGVSMPLTRRELTDELRPALLTAGIALVGATLVAMLLAQVLLRPIHVIRSGLSRLGRGEFDVAVDLPQHDEFGDLGGFFNRISAQVSADRKELAGQKAKLESVVEHLEDAVAMFTPDGELLFANPAMRETLIADSGARTVSELLAPDHPYRRLVEETMASGQSCGPVSAAIPRLPGIQQDPSGLPATADRLIVTNAITDRDNRTVGIMLVARNIEYLAAVQSTLHYSQKLVALGRLSAGVAHEIKNPLNATMIHLELLKQRLSAFASSPTPGESQSAGRDGGPDVDAALGHVAIIAGEMRRLDQVVQGFLKFARPDDLKLQTVTLRSLFEQVAAVIDEEARACRVDIVIECAPDMPALRGDPGMLQQAFLNLALNAVQAMPDGGRLRMAGAAVADWRIEAVFEDTGVGITPEHLGRIFDLYFTTKQGGSGIGLSLVFRTVQLHDGEIEVRSTLGGGAAFRLLFPRAQTTLHDRLLGS
ncbi:MAG: ATP-binding protein [Acidobacteriota bacterium]